MTFNMQAPLTVFDRIKARLEKSEAEGTAVVKFLLGKSEIDCLKEWCRADEIEEIDGSSGGFLFRGVAIEPVNFYSYFAYELLELALV